ncbi:DUF6708 domain-containing protein, partial [Atlantibacter hermannii]|uniref:DUF6708 domain-containing protein n=1 Tax=Atlantibacter hermannii TaxID=565 RepID=UPI00307640CB
MDNNKSRLVKPVRGWSEDLPDPEEEQRVFPRLIRVNEINDVWMEIPRYVNHGWGGIWFAGVVGCFVIGVFALIDMSTGMYLKENGFVSVMPYVPLVIVTYWVFRNALFAARGAPVRFNRKQQKVYVYEQKRSIWPWWKWPVEIKVFDWADIQG